MPPSDYLAPTQGSTDVESKLCETTFGALRPVGVQGKLWGLRLRRSSRVARRTRRDSWSILLEQAWGLPVSSAAALGLAFGRYDGWEIPWPLQQGDLYRSGRFAFSPSRSSRQAGSGCNQTDGDAARPVARLFARCSGTGVGHRPERGAGHRT